MENENMIIEETVVAEGEEIIIEEVPSDAIDVVVEEEADAAMADTEEIVGEIADEEAQEEAEEVEEEAEESESGLGFKLLMVQGIATSIDALSVGFTISEYGFIMALVSALIIAAVTFVICMAGVIIGKKFGTKLANKASVLGGVILIVIGLEIFITGLF